MTKKVLSVFGTRPEAIKMAPVVKALDAHPEIDSRVCVTAQHREMLDQVLSLFEITPDHDLNIMAPAQDLYDVTTRIMLGLREVLREEKPDTILVHGDTATTFAASLAAFYEQIPVGHVEAGLRTGNLYSPWPEEANRKLTGVLAAYHFAPTATSQQALIKESVPERAIHITGNTVIDALLMVRDRIDADSDLKAQLESELPYGLSRKMVLVTGHRRESFGGGFERICKALAELAKAYPDTDIVYPVHLNPNVQEPVKRILSRLGNVYLIPPPGLPAIRITHEQGPCDSHGFRRHPGRGSIPGQTRTGNARYHRAAGSRRGWHRKAGGYTNGIHRGSGKHPVK